MSHSISFPFTPPWENLQQTVETQNAPCHFFHTDCKSLSREEKRRADEAMVKAYQEACRMQRLSAMGKAGEAGGKTGQLGETSKETHRP